MRVAIFSDVHLSVFAPSDAVDHPEAPRVTRLAVEQARDCDAIVLLGDITETGSPPEVTLAREVFAPVGARLRAITGNHDLQQASLEAFTQAYGGPPFRAERWEPATVLFLSSGIERQPDTQWGGRLGSEQLAFMDAALAKSPAGPVLIFCHHPLRGTVAKSDEVMMHLDDSDALLARLARHAGPITLFTGHTHRPDRVEAAMGMKHLTCIACPALSEPPHEYLVMEVGGADLSGGVVSLTTRTI